MKLFFTLMLIPTVLFSEVSQKDRIALIDFICDNYAKYNHKFTSRDDLQDKDIWYHKGYEQAIGDVIEMIYFYDAHDVKSSSKS